MREHIDESLRNRTIIKTLAGFMIGMILGVSFLIAFGDLDSIGAHRFGFFLQMAGPGLFGAVALGTTFVYEIEDWGLARATLIHYLVTMAAFFLCNALLHWVSFGTTLAVYAGVFTLLYGLIWVGEWLVWNRTTKDMNRLLNSNFLKKKRLQFIIGEGGKNMVQNTMLEDEEMLAATGGTGGMEDLPRITSVLLADPFPQDPRYPGVWDECRMTGYSVFELSDGNIAVAAPDMPGLSTGDEVLVRQVRGYYGWEIRGVVDY